MPDSGAVGCDLLGRARTLSLLPVCDHVATAAAGLSGRLQHQQHQQYAMELNLLAFLSGLHHSHIRTPNLQAQQQRQQRGQESQREDEGAAAGATASAEPACPPPLGSVHRLVLLGEAWQLRLPPLAAAAAAGLPKPLTSLAAGLGAYLPNLTHLDLAPAWELTPAGLALAAEAEAPAAPELPGQQEHSDAAEAGGGHGGTPEERLCLSSLLAASSRRGLVNGCGGGSGGAGTAAAAARGGSSGVAGGSCPAVDLAAARGLAGLQLLRHLSARLAIGDSDRMGAWAGALAALPPSLISLRLLGPLCYCPDLAAAVAGWADRLPALRRLHLELGECCHSHPDLEAEMYGDPESWTSSCFAGVLPNLTQLRSLQLDVDEITADLWRDALACCATAAACPGTPAAGSAAPVPDGPAIAVAAAAAAVADPGGNGTAEGPGGAVAAAGRCTEGGLQELRLRQRGFSGACDGAGIAHLHGLTDLCLTLGDGPNLSDLSCLTRLTRLELQLLGLADYVAAAAEASAAVAAEVLAAPTLTSRATAGPAASCNADGHGAAAAASASTLPDTDAASDLAALANLAIQETPAAEQQRSPACTPPSGQAGACAELMPDAPGSLPAPSGLLPLITRGLCRLRSLHLHCRSASVELDELGAIGRPDFCPRLQLLQLHAPLRAAAPTVASQGLAPRRQQRGRGIYLPGQLEWLALVNTDATPSQGGSWARPLSSRSPHGGAAQRPAVPPLLRLSGLPPGLRHLQLAGVAVEVEEAAGIGGGAPDAEGEGEGVGRGAARCGPGAGASAAAAPAHVHAPQACTPSVSLVGCVVRCPPARLWGSGLRVLDLTGSTLLAPEPCQAALSPDAPAPMGVAGAAHAESASLASASIAAAAAGAPAAVPSKVLAEALACCTELRQLRLWGCCRGGGLLRPLGDAALAALVAAHPRLHGLELNATAATPEGLAALAALRCLRVLRVLVAGQEGAAALGRALAAVRAAPGPAPGPGQGRRRGGATDLEFLEVVMAASGLAFVADCVREQLVAGLPGVAVQLRAQQGGD
ncbi:hypothetical protein HXX76_003744 [Chlamydomonas incerta]|uniref:Uncharacterized protein n=1 Tax=Chlamydomonas incerta TaxID=51695 RepID=A0A835W669_CHLIN|nr:hypothetical protein HXX76_003744 [Chlamydomonas incerta]|eukprot:KAG2440890.1 hypothetical protein HXX76_003744 [Chlamydomonas incerta]